MSDTLHNYVLDPLERAASTFVQQFVTVLLATGSAGVIGYQNWGKAADVALWAALLSIVTSVLTFGVPKLNAGLDLVLRVVKTFVQSFFGVLIAAGTTSFISAGWKDALATAIPVALLALLKGAAGVALPWTDGASLLPVSPLSYSDPLDLAPAATDEGEASDPVSDPAQLDSVKAGEPENNGGIITPSQITGTTYTPGPTPPSTPEA